MGKADRELMEMLIGTIERNTSALEGVKTAIKSNEEKNNRLADGMDQMASVITGAQRKIGGEIGPIIDRMQDTQQKLEEERRALIDAGAPPPGAEGPSDG